MHIFQFVHSFPIYYSKLQDEYGCLTSMYSRWIGGIYPVDICKKNAVFHIPHGPAETFCILMHVLSETVRSREWL